MFLFQPASERGIFRFPTMLRREKKPTARELLKGVASEGKPRGVAGRATGGGRFHHQNPPLVASRRSVLAFRNRRDEDTNSPRDDFCPFKPLRCRLRLPSYITADTSSSYGEQKKKRQACHLKAGSDTALLTGSRRGL